MSLWIMYGFVRGCVAFWFYCFFTCNFQLTQYILLISSFRYFRCLWFDMERSRTKKNYYDMTNILWSLNKNFITNNSSNVQLNMVFNKSESIFLSHFIVTSYFTVVYPINVYYSHRYWPHKKTISTTRKCIIFSRIIHTTH